jgi:hypothetical protein
MSISVHNPKRKFRDSPSICLPYHIHQEIRKMMGVILVRFCIAIIHWMYVQVTKGRFSVVFVVAMFFL